MVLPISRHERSSKSTHRSSAKPGDEEVYSSQPTGQGEISYDQSKPRILDLPATQSEISLVVSQYLHNYDEPQYSATHWSDALAYRPHLNPNEDYTVESNYNTYTVTDNEEEASLGSDLQRSDKGKGVDRTTPRIDPGFELSIVHDDDESEEDKWTFAKSKHSARHDYHSANYLGESSSTAFQYNANPRYRDERSRRFQPGTVFMVDRPQGHEENARPISRDTDYDVAQFYKEFPGTDNSFIVVASDEGYSQCVPILTYDGQGCAKSGVNPSHHGIIHTHRHKPRLLVGEPNLQFRPVAMSNRLVGEYEKLHKASRVLYSKLVMVDHDVRIRIIGSVSKSGFKAVQRAVDTCWAESMSVRAFVGHAEQTGPNPATGHDSVQIQCTPVNEASKYTEGDTQSSGFRGHWDQRSQNMEEHGRQMQSAQLSSTEASPAYKGEDSASTTEEDSIYDGNGTVVSKSSYLVDDDQVDQLLDHLFERFPLLQPAQLPYEQRVSLTRGFLSDLFAGENVDTAHSRQKTSATGQSSSSSGRDSLSSNTSHDGSQRDNHNSPNQNNKRTNGDKEKELTEKTDRQKRGRVTRSDTDQRLTCPFRVLRPSIFNIRDHLECATKDWNFIGIPELRRHIKKHHGQKSTSCDRCKMGSKVVEDDDEKTEAKKERNPRYERCDCAQSPTKIDLISDPLQGIDSEQRNELKTRRGRLKHSAYEQYLGIWDILFPGADEKPQTPEQCYLPLVEHFELQQRYEAGIDNLCDRIVRQTGSPVRDISQLRDVVQTKFADIFQECGSCIWHYDKSSAIGHNELRDSGIDMMENAIKGWFTPEDLQPSLKDFVPWLVDSFDRQQFIVRYIDQDQNKTKWVWMGPFCPENNVFEGGMLQPEADLLGRYSATVSGPLAGHQNQPPLIECAAMAAPPDASLYPDYCGPAKARWTQITQPVIGMQETQAYFEMDDNLYQSGPLTHEARLNNPKSIHN